jgi:hypothetical protein
MGMKAPGVFRRGVAACYLTQHERSAMTDDDRDVRPSRLAHELGLSEDEARKLRHDVEYGIVMAPWRVEHRGRIQLNTKGTP